MASKWAEEKRIKDLYANLQLKRGFVIKPEFNKPGFLFTSVDGNTKYYIDKNGSRRRVK